MWPSSHLFTWPSNHFHTWPCATYIRDQVVTYTRDQVATYIRDQVVTYTSDKVATYTREQVATYVRDLVATYTRDQDFCVIPCGFNQCFVILGYDCTFYSLATQYFYEGMVSRMILINYIYIAYQCHASSLPCFFPTSIFFLCWASAAHISLAASSRDTWVILGWRHFHKRRRKTAKKGIPRGVCVASAVMQAAMTTKGTWGGGVRRWSSCDWRGRGRGKTRGLSLALSMGACVGILSPFRILSRS